MKTTEKLLLADFVYVREQDLFVHMPTRRLYSRCEIDRLFPPVPVLDADEDREERRH